MKKIIKAFLICILLFVFIYCSYNIINYLNNSIKNKKVNENLEKLVVKENLKDKKENLKIKVEGKKEELIPNIEIDFNKLNEINSKIKAWIYMEDSIINYPVYL